MQLTLYSDYSLRVLIYLALNKDKLTHISDISDSYQISRNHLVKVVNNLVNLGFVNSIRGKGGGLSLACEPSAINIADVVRKTEANFYIVECFEPGNINCPITPICSLRNILNDAFDAFVNVVEQYTLEDVLGNKKQLSRVLEID